jgi:hypothetical protein
VSTCIFCGRSPTTNAHIFRKAWLEQVFPGLEQFEHRHQRRGEGGFDRSWSKDEADIKVGCACADCNGGWMDRLDHAAEEIFATAAATGHPAKIATLADQLTVARWCALIAVLADQTQVKPVVEPAAHKALAAGDIPNGTHIWLLKTEPPESRAHGWLEPRVFEMRSSSAITPASAYFVTFGIHHLVVQVFIPTSSAPPIALERTGNEALIRQLWPSPLTPVNYPPPQTVPWEQLPDLADAFQDHKKLGR